MLTKQLQIKIQCKSCATPLEVILHQTVTREVEALILPCEKCLSRHWNKGYDKGWEDRGKDKEKK